MLEDVKKGKVGKGSTTFNPEAKKITFRSKDALVK